MYPRGHCYKTILLLPQQQRLFQLARLHIEQHDYVQFIFMWITHLGRKKNHATIAEGELKGVPCKIKNQTLQAATSFKYVQC